VHGARSAYAGSGHDQAPERFNLSETDHLCGSTCKKFPGRDVGANAVVTAARRGSLPFGKDFLHASIGYIQNRIGYKHI
jgi:hypothetical protein